MESALRAGADQPGLRLIETLAWDGRCALRLPAHLVRMAGAARRLGWGFDAAVAQAALAQVAPARAPARLRLTLDALGLFQAQAAPLPPLAAVWRVALSPHRLDPGDPWLGIKSTNRARYDADRTALPPGQDEWLYLNTEGQVCEGTITTLFFDAGQGLMTPPLSCGLLPGVLRAEMLATGACGEAVLRAEDLGRVRLWLGNALRGLIPAVLS